MTANLLERLRALDTCAVSDALDHLHLSGATTGVRPMHQGCAKIAGHARTVEAVDAPAAPAGKHLATRTVAAAGPGDVVVIANQGRVNVSCWGDILTVAAQVNGKFQQGDYAGAVDASNKARTFAMIGTILGVVQVIGIIIYIIVVSVAVSNTPGYTIPSYTPYSP